MMYLPGAELDAFVDDGEQMPWDEEVVGVTVHLAEGAPSDAWTPKYIVRNRSRPVKLVGGWLA